MIKIMKILLRMSIKRPKLLMIRSKIANMLMINTMRILIFSTLSPTKNLSISSLVLRKSNRAKSMMMIWLGKLGLLASVQEQRV
jgi:putative ribosome biogenesis GTPase RsgA